MKEALENLLKEVDSYYACGLPSDVSELRRVAQEVYNTRFGFGFAETPEVAVVSR